MVLLLVYGVHPFRGWILRICPGMYRLYGRVQGMVPDLPRTEYEGGYSRTQTQYCLYRRRLAVRTMPVYVCQQEVSLPLDSLTWLTVWFLTSSKYILR